jgi:hypothetical protein
MRRSKYREEGTSCSLRRAKVSTQDFVLGVDQAEFGHQLSLADADWPTASDGKEPYAVVGGMRTIDPLRSLARVSPNGSLVPIADLTVFRQIEP